MKDYLAQAKRIQEKLGKAKQSDVGLKVFGATSHQYHIGPVVDIARVTEFEKRFAVSLPECYKTFILHVGNGGIGYRHSAAGPFYGIYPFAEELFEIAVDQELFKQSLTNDCILHPDMSDEAWESLVQAMDDDEYDAERCRVLGGLLPIGSQGCQYAHAIIVNGPFFGRVINFDSDLQKPKFTFEQDFLDWYERWLDEIISGALLRDGPCWFGYCRGDPEEELIRIFLTTSIKKQKGDCLTGLLNKLTLSENAIEQLLHCYPAETDFQADICEIVGQFDYPKAQPLIRDLSHSDPLRFFQFLHWYGKSHVADWLPTITDIASSVDDEESFRFMTYVLADSGTDFGHLVVPFASHDNPEIRLQALYTLGTAEGKARFIEVFIAGLHDNENRVIHGALQALAGIKDRALLKHYQYIAKKFPVERDYILENLKHRLAEFGMTIKDCLDMP